MRMLAFHPTYVSLIANGAIKKTNQTKPNGFSDSWIELYLRCSGRIPNN